MGGHELCADDCLVEEAGRNLAAKGGDEIAILEVLLPRVLISPLHPASPAPVTPPLPEKDRPVLAAAILPHCDALLTGNSTQFGNYGDAPFTESQFTVRARLPGRH